MTSIVKDINWRITDNTIQSVTNQALDWSVTGTQPDGNISLALPLDVDRDILYDEDDPSSLWYFKLLRYNPNNIPDVRHLLGAIHSYYNAPITKEEFESADIYNEGDTIHANPMRAKVWFDSLTTTPQKGVYQLRFKYDLIREMSRIMALNKANPQHMQYISGYKNDGSYDILSGEELYHTYYIPPGDMHLLRLFYYPLTEHIHVPDGYVNAYKVLEKYQGRKHKKSFYDWINKILDQGIRIRYMEDGKPAGVRSILYIFTLLYFSRYLQVQPILFIDMEEYDNVSLTGAKLEFPQVLTNDYTVIAHTFAIKRDTPKAIAEIGHAVNSLRENNIIDYTTANAFMKDASEQLVRK